MKAYTIILSVALIGLAACGKKKSGDESGTFGSVSSGNTLAVAITTTWFPSNVNVDVQQCEAGEAAGSSVVCNVKIPEAQLQYSSLNFRVVGGAGVCDVVEFTPYSYLASTSATFIPMWSGAKGTAIDCSGTTTPRVADCFGGAAKYIVPSFPDFGSVYYTPNVGGIAELKVSSPSPASKISTNRMHSNHMTNTSLKTTGVTLGGDGLVANTFQDYEVSCRNKFGEKLYSITIVIDDEETATNDYSDWN